MNYRSKKLNIRDLNIATDTVVPIIRAGHPTYRSLGELEVGDLVFRPDETPTEVVALGPVGSVGLRLHFTDGVSLDTSEETLLPVRDRARSEDITIAAGPLSWRRTIPGWRIRYVTRRRFVHQGQRRFARAAGIVGFQDIEDRPGRGVVVAGGGLFVVTDAWIPVFAAEI